MRQLGKYKFCDWPIGMWDAIAASEVARCSEVASNLVYTPEETWLCEEHYDQYQLTHEKSLSSKKEQQR